MTEEQKTLMEMNLQERKRIRMMRFNDPTSAAVDPKELIQNLEEDKIKRLERMKKFGTETVLGNSEKKKERMERFNTQNEDKLDPSKVAERKARFGTLSADQKAKTGNLEFTLDDYRVRQKKILGKKKLVKGKPANGKPVKR